jgi:APA family basic amino acid/polyamine antiporter
MPKTEDQHLKREVKWFGSFAMGYADVGADVFIAIGLVAFYAAGASPIAFLLASVTYICTALSYAELTSTYPYAGGAQVYAMKAFNDAVGFLAGWTVMLDYTIDIALFAVASAGYWLFLFPEHKKKGLEFIFLGSPHVISYIGLLAFALVVLLVIINIVGIRESSFLNETMVALSLVVNSLIIIFGVFLAFSFGQFIYNITILGAPVPRIDVAYIQYIKSIPRQNFIYGVTIAMTSFIGIESIAQAAEETKHPTRWIPRAFRLSIFFVILFAIGLSVVAMGMMPWDVLAENRHDPIAKMTSLIPIVGKYFAVIVAITGGAICLVSTNTGVIGVSRITYSMARFNLLPSWFYKVHPRFRTPIRSIILFSAIGAILAVTANLDLIADLYNFGAVLSYIIVNLALIVIRNKNPEAHRAYKSPMTFRLPFGKRWEVPFFGLLGFISCIIIWIFVITFHPYGRKLGFSWLAIGIVMYILYRRKKKLPIFSTETGKTIMPSGYTMHAVVLVRTPEKEESMLSSLHESHIDSRIKITLLNIVDPLDLNLDFTQPEAFKRLDQYKLSASDELSSLAKKLRDEGFIADWRVEVGPFEKIVEVEAENPFNDIVVLIKRKTMRYDIEKEKFSEIYNILSRHPAKLMVIRRRE